jgi:transcriptional regulator with XRE-family HTH domain
MLQSVDFDAVRAALRREREAKNWSRAKLEEETGISEATIFKIETKWIDPRSRRPYIPSADQILRLITGLLGTSVAEFFAKIEGTVTQAVTPLDQGSELSQGGRADDPASVNPGRLKSLRSRDRALASEVRHAISALTHVATQLEEETRTARPKTPGRPRRHRKAS